MVTHLLSPIWPRDVVRLSVWLSVAAFGVAAAMVVLTLTGSDITATQIGETWGSLYHDPLSVLMGLVIAGISLLVRLYSIRYMAEEAGYERFFVLLDLMAAALLTMVAAADLLTLLIAWHLIGVFLYFLLGQDTRSERAYRYGFWTFITYRFGDLPLVLASVMLWKTFDTLSLPVIFEKIAADPDIQVAFGLPLVETVAVLVGIAAFARSAQFLLHNWLPYTMSGPTPVSALMHAGVVNAGGFLINRFAPIYALSEGVLPWVFVVGLVTSLIGSALMLAQSDVKKALGYSTMGQMGFMVMECGAGAFSLAVFHLVAHGLFKGTLFLGAGGAIGDARQSDGVPKQSLYSFIVDREPPTRRQPWVFMALFTILFPAMVFAGTHLFVAPDLFQKQGAIVLLFFGWVTGAQLVFATYSMNSTNPWRLLWMMMGSFVVVVIGYTLISHAFDVYLYPDQDLTAQLYRAGHIHEGVFTALIGAAALAIVVSWVRAYAGPSPDRSHRTRSELWLNFYALLQREFYIIDVYAALSRWVLQFSARLNVWFRWG
jgi:NADH-quinone oxidoreductase subunit L